MNVERSLAVSIEVMLVKNRDMACSADTDEVLKIPYHQNFNLAIFKETIKNSGDYNAINEYVIERFRAL